MTQTDNPDGDVPTDVELQGLLLNGDLGRWTRKAIEELLARRAAEQHLVHWICRCSPCNPCRVENDEGKMPVADTWPWECPEGLVPDWHRDEPSEETDK
jgi:hypothetical protein